METKTEKQLWEEYCAHELAQAKPLLAQLDISVDTTQQHIAGERYLTKPLGSGRKLLLLGRRTTDNKRVVIKVSSDPKGVAEIMQERTSRRVLEEIAFAYSVFLSPAELLFMQKDGLTFLITEFIEQPKTFLERPIEEQFALALKAFKAQESAHATTSTHIRVIKNTFGEMRGTDYVRTLSRYVDETSIKVPHDEHLRETLHKALSFFSTNQKTIEQYAGFLTHWDFMPQNIRIQGNDIYLLDHSSLYFGNKYEGWARFVNFMSLYNPTLANALVTYVKDNRTHEESLSLLLMRIYRLGELIRYYAGWLSRTDGDLHTLALARIHFWSQILEAVMNDTEVHAEVIELYRKIRDSLRSREEKERQIGLH